MNFDEYKKMWGQTVTKYSQIAQVFIDFLKGNIRKYPFSEGSIQPETMTIMDPLIFMNKNLLFTINSQPKVNGALY